MATRLLGILSLLLLGNACSLLSTTVKPEVHVVNLLVNSATLFETKITVDVRVENDNPTPIAISGSVHRLYINGEYIGKGYDKEGFDVAPLDSTVVPLEFTVSHLSLLTKLQSLFNSDRLEYRVESVLHGGGLGGSYRVQDSGSISLISPKGSRTLQFQAVP